MSVQTLWTVRGVAARTGTTPKTIYWTATGRIPFIRLGALISFDPDVIARFGEFGRPTGAQLKQPPKSDRANDSARSLALPPVRPQPQR